MSASADVFSDSAADPAGEAGEPRISYVVARLERAIRRSINERVSVFGLTVLQYTTLSVIGRREELSNAQLARRAYMSPQAMIQVITQLEDKGLIKRSQHPNHRRVYLATLTAKGRRVLAACEKLVDEMEAEVFAEMTAADKERIRRDLINAVRAFHAGLPEHDAR